MSTGAEVREWAAANGWVTGKRGRFHRDLIAAFDAAHPGSPYVIADRTPPPRPTPAPQRPETMPQRERQAPQPRQPAAPKPKAPARRVPEWSGSGDGTDQRERHASWIVSNVYTANGRNIVRGTFLTVKGIKGRLLFIEHVTTPDGQEWITACGGTAWRHADEGRPMADRVGTWEIRSFHPDRIRTVHVTKAAHPNSEKAKRTLARKAGKKS